MTEGTVHLIYENINGLNTRMKDNEKLEKMRKLHDDLEVDKAAYCEHKINYQHKKNANGFNQLFRGGEAEICSIVAHNVHENVGKIQQGGTSLILFDYTYRKWDTFGDRTSTGIHSYQDSRPNDVSDGVQPWGHSANDKEALSLD
jgi:hypothetical protein